MDASAILAVVFHEQGEDTVADAIAGQRPIMHALNLCEAYYRMVRELGQESAARKMTELYRIVAIKDDMTPEFLREAGDIKARGRISLADAFAIALAIRNDAVVYTSDRGEFGPVAEAGVCRVEFIR